LPISVLETLIVHFAEDRLEQLLLEQLGGPHCNRATATGEQLSGASAQSQALLRDATVERAVSSTVRALLHTYTLCKRGIRKAAVFDSLSRVVLDAPDTTCCICLDNFSGEEAIRLACNRKHVFHESCISAWLRDSSTCPVCRY
jgi:hypothetical protein